MRLDEHEFDRARMCDGPQPIGDVIGLPEGQRAAARAESEWHHSFSRDAESAERSATQSILAGGGGGGRGRGRPPTGPPGGGRPHTRRGAARRTARPPPRGGGGRPPPPPPAR